MILELSFKCHHVDTFLYWKSKLFHTCFYGQVYDSPESELRLNEIFEFIGVLSFDSELELNKEEADLQSNSLYEDDLIHLPPSKVCTDFLM